MQITAISDTHRKHSHLDLDSGDILIHAGDVGANNKENLINFLGWFQKQDYQHKIFVGGNHDGWMQENPGQVKYVMNDYDVIYLQDDYVTINGVKIWGSPWSLEFGGWSFMKTEEGMSELVSGVPDNMDIIIMHGPPYGILDKEKFGEHCGSVHLNKLKPKYFVCGHIHENNSTSLEKNNTTYINASVVNRTLDVVNKKGMSFEYGN